MGRAIEPELTEGLQVVRFETDAADEVAALWRACEMHDNGVADATAQDFVASWQQPSFELGERAVGVRDGEQLVGYADVAYPKRADVCVLPSHRHRGIGAALMRWTWAVATELAYDRIGQPISEHVPDAIALLESHGYTRRYTSWVLEIAHSDPPAPPELPRGYTLREFVPGRDDHAAYQVIEEAFSEWPGREGRSEDDWSAEVLGRPGFIPARLPLVVCGDEVVGALVLVDDDADDPYVDQLAVARAHRGRGLGRALLMHAFGVLWSQGQRVCGLATDSRTGALGLYEHVGMTVQRSYFHLAKDLPA